MRFIVPIMVFISFELELCLVKGVSSPRRGREGMQLQACAVDHQKLYE